MFRFSTEFNLTLQIKLKFNSDLFEIFLATVMNSRHNYVMMMSYCYCGFAYIFLNLQKQSNNKIHIKFFLGILTKSTHGFNRSNKTTVFDTIELFFYTFSKICPH